MIRRFLREEDGPTSVEYAVMLSLILLGALVAIEGLGTRVAGTFENVTNRSELSGY